MADLADLRKAIILCRSCIGKFNYIAAGYTRKPNLPFVQGRCDGCKQHASNAHFLVHHSLVGV